MNELTVEIYSGTTRVRDPDNELARAVIEQFDTFYSNGLFGSCSIFVPRGLTDPWEVEVRQRIVIRDGQMLVWEGEIDDIENIDDKGSGQEGARLNCTGKWGCRMMKRSLRRLYVDMRVDEYVWQAKEAAAGKAICTIERQTTVATVDTPCILFNPENAAWELNQYTQVIYDAPKNELIKEVKFNYDLTVAGGRTWKLELYDIQHTSSLWSVTAEGTGTKDQVLATPSNQIALRFTATTAQTPPGTGKDYGLIYNLKVYAKTNNTELIANEMSQIVKDLVATYTTIINQDTREIDTPGTTFTLEPFITDGYLNLADLINKVVSYGDGAQNSWAAGFLDSEDCSWPDGLPVLFLEMWPDLNSAEYYVRAGDPNVVALPLRYDGSQLANYLIVEFDNFLGGKSYVTPDDDATLKNQASIDAWGQFDLPLSYGLSNQTTAINLARAELAARKEPAYYLTGPIVVQDYLLDTTGQKIPVSQVRAGKRIKILDFLQDLSGAGLTMVMTKNTYRHADRTLEIGTGVQDDLATSMAQQDYWGGDFKTHPAK